MKTLVSVVTAGLLIPRHLWCWIFPTGRGEEYTRDAISHSYQYLHTMSGSQIEVLTINACDRFLIVTHRGPYRAALGLALRALRLDITIIGWAWKERFKYASLRLRGWDRLSIRAQQDSELAQELDEIRE